MNLIMILYEKIMLLYDSPKIFVYLLKKKY